MTLLALVTEAVPVQSSSTRAVGVSVVRVGRVRIINAGQPAQRVTTVGDPQTTCHHLSILRTDPYAQTTCHHLSILRTDPYAARRGLRCCRCPTTTSRRTLFPLPEGEG